MTPSNLDELIAHLCEFRDTLGGSTRIQQEVALFDEDGEFLNVHDVGSIELVVTRDHPKSNYAVVTFTCARQDPR